MKNNVSPRDLVVHPHYNEGNNQYDVKIADIAKGLIDAGFNPAADDNDNWWEDENLWSEIYEREFNFAETKYLGITISYKLSELVFENIIMLRMVFDMKDSFYDESDDSFLTQSKASTIDEFYQEIVDNTSQSSQQMNLYESEESDNDFSE